MSFESLVDADVVLVAVSRGRVRRVASDVDQEEIELAVAVVVEEHRGRGVSDVVEARRRGDVLEAAAAVVFEETVAASYGGDVKIRIAVIVDVGKRRRDAYLVRHRHTGGCRDVLEPAAAEVSPELVAAHLVDEVDVQPAVRVDVGHRQTVAVIVVNRFVGLAGVGDDAVLERDAAFDEAVGEPEIVERRQADAAFACAAAALWSHVLSCSSAGTRRIGASPAGTWIGAAAAAPMAASSAMATREQAVRLVIGLGLGTLRSSVTWCRT